MKRQSQTPIYWYHLNEMAVSECSACYWPFLHYICPVSNVSPVAMGSASIHERRLLKSLYWQTCKANRCTRKQCYIPQCVHVWCVKLGSAYQYHLRIQRCVLLSDYFVLLLLLEVTWDFVCCRWLKCFWVLMRYWQMASLLPGLAVLRLHWLPGHTTSQFWCAVKHTSFVIAFRQILLYSTNLVI